MKSLILAAVALAIASGAAHAQYYNNAPFGSPSPGYTPPTTQHFGYGAPTPFGQPMPVYRPTNCTSSRVGNQVYTSCY